MPTTTLYDSDAGKQDTPPKNGGIFTGVVVDNCEGAMQGKVLLRLPALNTQVWARLISTGGGSNVGLFKAPPPGTEVLVTFLGDNPEDAYLFGGLFNNTDKPPIDKPTDLQTRTVLRTGVAPSSGVPPVAGHTIDLDDAEQTVTITTSTEQQVRLSPEKIEIVTTGGTLKITLDLAQQSISIEAPVSLNLTAQGSIKLQAANVEINGTAMTKITGGVVMIN